MFRWYVILPKIQLVLQQQNIALTKLQVPKKAGHEPTPHTERYHRRTVRDRRYHGATVS